MCHQPQNQESAIRLSIRFQCPGRVRFPILSQINLQPQLLVVPFDWFQAGHGRNATGGQNYNGTWWSSNLSNTVLQWLALMPYSKKVLDLDWLTAELFFVEFAYSACAWVSFLQVLTPLGLKESIDQLQSTKAKNEKVAASLRRQISLADSLNLILSNVWMCWVGAFCQITEMFAGWGL